MAGLIVAVVVVFFAVVLASRMVRIIPQARAGVVERLGRYSRTLDPGLTMLVPFIDRVKPLIDLREQVVNFAPQPVITEDNVVVGIETVLYFTITEPKSATYEIANPLQAIEQLTVTTLRNVIGGLTLEATLTARESVNVELRGALDDATGKWGIRINRVEIKSVDPPADIRAAMEKQMRAERDRRAAILTAQGTKQAAILTAEGEKQSAVLKAEGARQAAILRAEGEAKAIATVFDAIHAGDPDEKLLSYQYLQMLPELARGDSNKVFVIPSEFTQAFAGIGNALNEYVGRGPGGSGSRGPSGSSGSSEEPVGTKELEEATPSLDMTGEEDIIGASGLTPDGQLAADPGADDPRDPVGEVDLGLLPGDGSVPTSESPGTDEPPE
jgi:regulator of protease activity HflC (stomatin/prohibitin superfamily)